MPGGSFPLRFLFLFAPPPSPSSQSLLLRAAFSLFPRTPLHRRPPHPPRCLRRGERKMLWAEAGGLLPGLPPPSSAAHGRSRGRNVDRDLLQRLLVLGERALALLPPRRRFTVPEPVLVLWSPSSHLRLAGQRMEWRRSFPGKLTASCPLAGAGGGFTQGMRPWGGVSMPRQDMGICASACSVCPHGEGASGQMAINRPERPGAHPGELVRLSAQSRGREGSAQWAAATAHGVRRGVVAGVMGRRQPLTESVWVRDGQQLRRLQAHRPARWHGSAHLRAAQPPRQWERGRARFNCKTAL